MNDASRPVLTLNRKPKPKDEPDEGIRVPKFRNREVVEAKPRHHKTKSKPPVTQKPKPPAKEPKARNQANIKKEKIPVPPTPPKKRMNIIEALGVITRYWPDLFPDGQLRPMKIGLKEELLKDKKARELPVSGRELSRCLSSISYSGGYRLTVVAGAHRYDKEGQPCGTVTPEEEADSVQRLEKIRKRHAGIKGDKPDQGLID